MSHLHSSPAKSLIRELEAAEKARKTEISHKNLMNALANCPIVASEDLERSDYNFASKSDIQRMKNAQRRVHAIKNRTSLLGKPDHHGISAAKRKHMTRPFTA